MNRQDFLTRSVEALRHNDVTMLDSGEAQQRVERCKDFSTRSMIAMEEISDRLLEHATISPYGFEDLTGETYSAEALSATLKDFWARILRFMRAAWRRLYSFLESIFNRTTLIADKLSRTRYRFASIQGRQPVKGQVNLGLLTTLLTLPGYRDGDDAAVDVGMKELIVEMKFLRDKYLPEIERLGRELRATFDHQRLHPGTPKDFLRELNRVSDNRDIFQLSRSFPRLFKMPDPRYVEGSAMRGPFLLGRRTMVFVDGRKTNSAYDRTNDISLAGALQNTTVTLIRTNNDQTPPAMMDVATTFNLGNWIDYVDELLAQMRAMLKDSRRLQAQEHARALERSATLISEHSDIDDPTYRRALRYARSYQTWIESPLVEYLNHCATVCDGVLTLVNMHFVHYRESNQ